MGKKRIIKAHTDKAGQSVGVENLVINNDLTVNGGIVGKTDGVDVAAGQVGEVIEVTSTTPLVAGTHKTVATIPLTKGVWLLSGRTQQGDFTANRVFIMSINNTIDTSSGTILSGSFIGPMATYDTAGGNGSIALSNVYVNISADDDYYLNVFVSAINGANSCKHYFQAVRIA